VPQCSYFDRVANKWSSEGCRVAEDNVVLPNGQLGIRCACHHLTEFAVLVGEAMAQNGLKCFEQDSILQTMFTAFAALYALCFAVSVVQVSFACL
jgi:hypothetical protein